MKTKSVIIVFSSVAILLIAYLLLSKWSNDGFESNLNVTPVPSQSATTKTFKSSNVMDFAIEVPVCYSINEKSLSVILNSEEGSIVIGQSGTNYESLDEYLDDLGEKNNFSLKEEEDILINSMKAKVGMIDAAKYYFIYTPDRVYSVFTESQALFSDLDQIAQSLRYTPN